MRDDLIEERKKLNFPNEVRKSFSFLKDAGFSEVEVLPTFVRYVHADIGLNIYHGRQSYEVGLEVTRLGQRYTISEIIGAVEPEVGKQYRNVAATTAHVLAEGLARLQTLILRYGQKVLEGDPEFFHKMERNRKDWAVAYALDVLAQQLRPKADRAFRLGDYIEAAELYDRIRPRLDSTGLKKLALARKRCSRGRDGNLTSE